MSLVSILQLLHDRNISVNNLIIWKKLFYSFLSASFSWQKLFLYNKKAGLPIQIFAGGDQDWGVIRYKIKGTQKKNECKPMIMS